jgi:hypothetical protein
MTPLRCLAFFDGSGQSNYATGNSWQGPWHFIDREIADRKQGSQTKSCMQEQANAPQPELLTVKTTKNPNFRYLLAFNGIKFFVTHSVQLYNVTLNNYPPGKYIR